MGAAVLSDKTYDVVIVGAGIVGCVAALYLAKKTSLNVALLETKAIHAAALVEEETRVSAISNASSAIFNYLNVWEAIRDRRVSVFQKMQVWDAETSGMIQFDCKEIAMPQLGYIIEDQVMRDSLYAAIAKTATIDFLHPVRCLSIERSENGVTLLTDLGQYQTKLLIAADGVHSWVRETLQFMTNKQAYDQTAIVATIETEHSHQKTAWQRFLRTGPLAFLPLKNENKCSIVWSIDKDQMASILNLNDAAFCEALTQAFESKLGKVVRCSQRMTFELMRQQVLQYVQESVALIGDAAHVIHPLAGQGVNLGIQDAVALVEVIEEALKKNRHYGALHVLRRYERKRKSDNTVMLTAVDNIKRVFQSDRSIIKSLRQTGLKWFDAIHFIKNQFMCHAGAKKNG